MNVVVLSRGAKVIPGPGQELYADTREARTCGGRQNAYLYFGQACQPTGIYDFSLHIILITIKEAIVKPLGIICSKPDVYFYLRPLFCWFRTYCLHRIHILLFSMIKQVILF
jgi:hypothetical protein